jgi:hypothetical protein
MKGWKHLGRRLAGTRSYEFFGAKLVRPPVYVVWATRIPRSRGRSAMKFVAYTAQSAGRGAHLLR